METGFKAGALLFLSPKSGTRFTYPMLGGNTDPACRLFTKVLQALFGRSSFVHLLFLGDNEGFILIIALVYWCINKSIGFWTMVVLLISDGINFAIKEITGLPRPSIFAKLE